MIEQAYQIIKEQLASNEFLAGGAVLGVAGMLFATLKSVPGKIYNWIQRRVFIEFEILNSDKAFDWIEQWLANQPYSKNRARWLAVRTIHNDDGQPHIILTPAPGTHYLFWRKRLVVLKRARKDAKEDALTTLKERETFTISILAINRKVIMEFLQELQILAVPPNEERVSILSPHIYCSGGGEWIENVERRPRPLSSVILPDGVIESIVGDVELFRSRESWYNDRGIPWRRGYLLHGPPGSGKSSLVFALASHLKLSLAPLNLNHPSLNDAVLQDLISNLRPNAILLIEDIDCVFDTKREGKKDKDNRVTFSGLLNAIDGVASSEGTLLFMTTNHLGQLDDALIRPGRCDVKQFIGEPNKTQVRRMYERFFPGTCGNEFAAKVSGVSMAAIQGYLIKYSESPKKTLECIQELIEGEG